MPKAPTSAATTFGIRPEPMPERVAEGQTEAAGE